MIRLSIIRSEKNQFIITYQFGLIQCREHKGLLKICQFLLFFIRGPFDAFAVEHSYIRINKIVIPRDRYPWLDEFIKVLPGGGILRLRPQTLADITQSHHQRHIGPGINGPQHCLFFRQKFSGEMGVAQQDNVVGGLASGSKQVCRRPEQESGQPEEQDAGEEKSFGSMQLDAHREEF